MNGDIRQYLLRKAEIYFYSGHWFLLARVKSQFFGIIGITRNQGDVVTDVHITRYLFFFINQVMHPFNNIVTFKNGVQYIYSCTYFNILIQVCNYLPTNPICNLLISKGEEFLFSFYNVEFLFTRIITIFRFCSIQVFFYAVLLKFLKINSAAHEGLYLIFQCKFVLVGPLGSYLGFVWGLYDCTLFPSHTCDLYIFGIYCILGSFTAGAGKADCKLLLTTCILLVDIMQLLRLA